MKIKKTKKNLMEPLEMFITKGNLKSLPVQIIALNKFLYGVEDCEMTISSKYVIKRERLWEISQQLARDYFDHGKNHYNLEKSIEAILTFLTYDGFDILRYNQNKKFKDSELNTRIIELVTVLESKSLREINSIINYLFNLKKIPLDSIFRTRIETITKTIHENKISELSNSAELALPLKAEILKYIKYLDFPYMNKISKSMFFIKMLGAVSLEMSEEIFDEYQNAAWQDNGEYFSLMFDEDHPFLKYDCYFDYVQERYTIINSFLTTK
jgi:hypothetical protein